MTIASAIAQRVPVLLRIAILASSNGRRSDRSH